jgi:peroxiredoxin Q/BCP
VRALIICVGIATTLAVVVLAARARTGKPRRSGGRLEEGEPAPDVGAPDQNGAAVRLSQFRGRTLVLYFYPKDQTSGCTIEAHGFSAAYERIRQSGAEVVGVSNDDARSHRRFCDSASIPFPLLADTDKSIAAAFGVRSIFGFYQRITFLIDAAGVIRKVFDPVSPARHAGEVLTAIAALGETAPVAPAP